MTTSTQRTPASHLVTLVVLVSQLTVGASGFAASGNGAAPESAGAPVVNLKPICQPQLQSCPPDPEPTPRPTPRPTPTPPPPPPSFTTMMNSYTGYDMDGDGRAEINSLKALFPNPEPYYATPNGVVIVLVDPHLVTDDPNIHMSRFEMSLWLSLLGNDISRDGFFPYFVEASVYNGPVHQDGRTLLAMRRFLKTVRANYPLAGVLLVGSFPDASIVRSVFVKATSYADAPVNFNSGIEPVNGYVGHFLALDSELITTRAEIVLGDLDGNWESLYRPTLNVAGYHALPLEPSEQYPQNGQYIYTPHFQAISQSFPDVFHIQDHNVTTNALGNGWLIMTINSVEEPSPEATAADQALPNRLARAEIMVSRIDPKRIAVKPTAPTDLDGKTSPIGADGRPQELRYNNPASVTWYRDPSLERQLVADYVARSHSFRLGYDDNLPFRTSAVRGAPGLMSPDGFNNLLRRSADGFEASTGRDLAMLVDYVKWLKEPAVLKGIAAHSDGVNSQFGYTPLSYYIAEAAGGTDASGTHVWRWVSERRGPGWVLTPSFEGLTVDASFFIYRTMWQTGALASAGQTFYVHDGCEVMRPKNAEWAPYNDPNYGQFDYYGHVANGESLMFYANGLGLMARNKVFNDTPAGFYEAIKATGGRFGAGWRAYFNTDGYNAGLNERALDPTVVNPGADRRERTLQRKRSYFWSMTGDPTIKIRY